MKRKVLEWIHRIVGFTIFESLIAVIGFVGLHYSMTYLISINNFNWGIRVGLIQSALAISYLQIANVFYWILGINLLDFKLWRKKWKSK